ncbi:MAG: hypothetical protein J6J35_05775 [Alphaproteobacteria bacterium]|nr:hypothetical protein [Alphaproteobacteria bacterium]
MTHNISYADKTLREAKASSNYDKILDLKYKEVFNEGSITVQTEIDTSCDNFTCYVSCSCQTGWKSSPSTINYIEVISPEDHKYAISRDTKGAVTKRDTVKCYKDVDCDYFGYLSSCPTGKTCTEVTPHGTLKCFKDPTCYFTESTSTTCSEEGYSISTTSCSSGYTLKQADGTTTTTYTSEASDCKKDSVTTTATNACGLCEQEGCPSGYFKKTEWEDKLNSFNTSGEKATFQDYIEAVEHYNRSDCVKVQCVSDSVFYSSAVVNLVSDGVIKIGSSYRQWPEKSISCARYTCINEISSTQSPDSSYFTVKDINKSGVKCRVAQCKYDGGDLPCVPHDSVRTTSGKDLMCAKVNNVAGVVDITYVNEDGQCKAKAKFVGTPMSNDPNVLKSFYLYYNYGSSDYVRVAGTWAVTSNAPASACEGTAGVPRGIAVEKIKKSDGTVLADYTGGTVSTNAYGCTPLVEENKPNNLNNLNYYLYSHY